MSTHDDQPQKTLDDCWNRIGVWSRQETRCPELKRFVHCRNCDRYSSAGRRMLERVVPEDYRAEWTRRFSHKNETAESCNHSVLLFRLGDEWLGIRSQYVNEITEIRTIHSLPHRENPAVKGLVNIRGELRICISIGSFLQLEKARESYITDHEILERMILVERDEQSFVFPVSEVFGTYRYTDRQVRTPPATVANAKNNFTNGIIAWNDTHVGIIDHELLFYALSRGLT